jgi:nucleotide-binding universal stress UspA family protein
MTILCATDFSPCSVAATELAASMARRFGGRLVLLHVVEPMAIPPEAPVGAAVWQEGMLEAAQARTALVARDVAREGLEVEPRTLLGPASALILDCARELEARFVVIGTHGRKATARFLLGSVAEKVARHARCPVVVTRAGALPGGWREEVPLRLAVAMDGTRSSHAALSWLGNLSQARDCDITAIRLYWPPQEAFRYGIDEPWLGDEGAPELVRLLERDLAAELRPSCPGGAPRLRLRAAMRDTAEALAAEAATLAPDAVVVGVSKGRERWPALSLGAVLRTCPAPVICVPETAAPAARRIPEVRSVLVATDLSESAPQLVLAACGLLQAGGRLELVHVHTAERPVTGPLEPQRREVLESALRGLIPPQAAALGIQASISVIEGHAAAEAILQASRRLEVDLIAVGSRGRSGLKRALLGSVTEAVARHATSPVLVVGPLQTGGAGASERSR